MPLGRVVRVPYLYESFRAGRRQRTTVGSERKSQRVAVMSGEDEFLLTVAGVVNPDQVIPGPQGKSASIGADRQCREVTAEPRNDETLLALFDVPETRGVVVGDGGESLPIGEKNRAENRVGVAHDRI